MKTAVLMMIVLLSALTTYRDPYVTIPTEVEVRTGETAHIEVIIEHVQTTMWNLKVYVDTEQMDSIFLQRLEVAQDNENPVLFDKEIPPATKVSALIDVAVAEDSPSGQVRIPIVVAGSKGPCLRGCEPFFVQKSTTLVIKKQDPKLALMLPETRFETHQGENITVEVQLKNYGATTAYVESLEAIPDKTLTIVNQTVPPKQVAPGKTESVVLIIVTEEASPGTYLIQVKLVYKDQVKNIFQDGKTIYVTILERKEPVSSSTPPVTFSPSPNPVENPGNPEEKYQYFLAGTVTGAGTFGVAVMFGLFLKKHRPAKS